MPDDSRMKRAGSPAEARLPKAITNPQASAAIGASATPTEATPSVASSEALRLPSS